MKTQRSIRRGSVLLEFALLSLVGYVLLAAILTFGFILIQANIAQQAADFGAQELSRMPLPASSWTGLSLETPVNVDGDTPRSVPELRQVSEATL